MTGSPPQQSQPCVQGGRRPNNDQGGRKTMVELWRKFDVHDNQIERWNDQLLEGAMNVFDNGCKDGVKPTIDVKTCTPRSRTNAEE